jgi:hypothetical protein
MTVHVCARTHTSDQCTASKAGRMSIPPTVRNLETTWNESNSSEKVPCKKLRTPYRVPLRHEKVPSFQALALFGKYRKKYDYGEYDDPCNPIQTTHQNHYNITFPIRSFGRSLVCYSTARWDRIRNLEACGFFSDKFDSKLRVFPWLHPEGTLTNYCLLLIHGFCGFAVWFRPCSFLRGLNKVHPLTAKPLVASFWIPQILTRFPGRECTPYISFSNGSPLEQFIITQREGQQNCKAVRNLAQFES